MLVLVGMENGAWEGQREMGTGTLLVSKVGCNSFRKSETIRLTMQNLLIYNVSECSLT
jgi:hypothetical protein